MSTLPDYYLPTKKDLSKVACTLGDAFFDYPIHKWLIPDDIARKKNHPTIGMVFASYGFRFGNLVATSENCEGVMLYAPSSEGDATTWQLIQSGFLS